MKKAFIVDFSIQTRIVIDTKDYDEEKIASQLYSEAYEKLSDLNVLQEYINRDNMDYKDDTEMPYNPEFDKEV